MQYGAIGLALTVAGDVELSDPNGPFGRQQKRKMFESNVLVKIEI